jgi:hypothetical protein
MFAVSTVRCGKNSCRPSVELSMKHAIDQTRCEKCAEVLGTHYEENGVTKTRFHQWLKITELDKAQNRFALCCPNCGHSVDFILTITP